MRIGVDIGGTKINAGLIDAGNGIVLKRSIETRHTDGSEATLGRLADLLERLAAESPEPVDAVGIGCAGMIDRASGDVVYSNNIEWNHVPLGRTVSERLGVPAYVDNDAICATIGEYVAGAGKAYSSMLMVTLGTGVGGGYILDDKLYLGHNGYANAIGHMVVEAGGYPCTCGRGGCLESYASATALIREASRLADRDPACLLARLRVRDGELNGKNVFAAIELNDAAAAGLFSWFLRYLSEGIANLVNILNPQSIVIGGGISSQGEQLLAPLREQVLPKLFCKEAAMPVIVTAKLGNDAGIVGAACILDFLG